MDCAKHSSLMYGHTLGLPTARINRLGGRQQAANVKHQRARATASRENGAISLRALRCMR